MSLISRTLDETRNLLQLMCGTTIDYPRHTGMLCECCLRSNLLRTVNSFGFDSKRRKAQRVRVQTQPSFTSRKRKTKWRAHFWSEWVRGGWRSAGAAFWHRIRICCWNIFTGRASCYCLQPKPTSHLLRNNSGASQLTGGKSHLSSSFHYWIH